MLFNRVNGKCQFKEAFRLIAEGKMVDEAFRTLAVLAYEAEMGLPEKPAPGRRGVQNPHKDPL